MINFPIDFVFPYVNNYDIVWQKNYESYCISSGNKHRLDVINSERYRDFGFLVYLFRGIEKFMPFIRNVYMIVQNIEQVPSWIDQNTVKIVLHKDFIPEQYLPTYNSTTIEMFIPDIDGLADHFIYGNDDIYVIGPTTAEDYFTDEGNPKMSFYFAQPKPEMAQYWKVCQNIYIDLKTALKQDVSREEQYLYPQHGLTPINKKQAIEARKLLENKFSEKITNFRSDVNYNQYIYPDYAYLIGKIPIDGSSRKFKYIALDKTKLNQIINVLDKDKYQELTLNDTEKTIFSYWHRVAHHINDAFHKKFPQKSKYEIMDGAIKC